MKNRLTSVLHSVAQLHLAANGFATMSNREWDHHWDQITAFLEEVNDEKFRVTPEGEKADT